MNSARRRALAPRDRRSPRRAPRVPDSSAIERPAGTVPAGAAAWPKAAPGAGSAWRLLAASLACMLLGGCAPLAAGGSVAPPPAALKRSEVDAALARARIAARVPRTRRPAAHRVCAGRTGGVYIKGEDLWLTWVADFHKEEDSNAFCEMKNKEK